MPDCYVRWLEFQHTPLPINSMTSWRNARRPDLATLETIRRATGDSRRAHVEKSSRGFPAAAHKRPHQANSVPRPALERRSTVLGSQKRIASWDSTRRSDLYLVSS
jgi:hypothetical protein